MGIRGSATYELIFQDCRIPKENLLGQQGKGFPIAMHTLDGGRIGIAAQALGIAEGALETTIDYVKERKQFGRSIAQQQNTQFVLADLATKVEAAQLLVYKAACAKMTQPCPPSSCGTGIPMKPNFCIFSTVPTGNCSVSSTS